MPGTGSFPLEVTHVLRLILGVVFTIVTHFLLLNLRSWRFCQGGAAEKSAFTICVQISFIYRGTEAKTLNWYQRWL